MNKTLVFVITFVVILGTAILIYTRGNEFANYQRKLKDETETAVNQAYFLYDTEKQRGRDFSSGPCLTNALLPGWVIDIVHDPRQPIDDLSSNQCSAYLEGSAKHFIELDPEGNLVRVQ